MHLNNFNLAGRTALVTGASSGIGFGLARGLAQAGARVVVAARRVDRLEALVAQIESEGGTALAVGMDVSDRTSIDRAFAEAENRFGVCDTVINNAGVNCEIKPFLSVTDEEFDFVIDTNLKGVWHVAQEGSRRMVAAKTSGSIINIASVLSLSAKAQHGPYCASKAGVAHLTRTLALDLARFNIRVNAIAPGYFRTEINEEFLDTDEGQTHLKKTPMRRSGHIEEIVGPVVMLVSAAGSFVNGAVLPVDGAHHAQLV